MVSFALGKMTDTPAKNTGFGGFSLGKNKKKKLDPTAKKSLKPFGSKADEDDDENNIVRIDTFDAKNGAFNKEEGPPQPKGPLIIKNEGNTRWRQFTKVRSNSKTNGNKEQEIKKLDYGINFINEDIKEKKERATSLFQNSKIDSFKHDIESSPDVATLEEYEEIPVEDFGAAMLRGMGWKGNEEDGKGKEKIIPITKRTQFLGLGAKDTTDGKPVTEKVYNPVKRINRRTGKAEEENDRKRERSPATESQSYRFRS